jgi:chitinase
LSRRFPWSLLRRCAVLLVAVLSCAAADPPPPVIVVYHDSWDEIAAVGPAATSIAALPGYLGIVDLAFARPDMHYAGDLDLSRTGLEYAYSGTVLRDAIALLRQRQPRTRVLLSVGGAAYHTWRDLNEVAVARLVHDLGADGVDIDFEPAHPGCAAGPDQAIHCRTDAVWQALIRRMRAVLPRPALLTAAVWSVGAYGEGEFQASRPHSRYTGFMLSVLRSPVASQLDLLSIDAYDAGPEYDPLEAYRAYRAVWRGPLALGLEVRRRDGSGPFFAPAQAEALARSVAGDGGGMMLYPLLAVPEGIKNPDAEDGRALAMAMCRGLGLKGCGTPPP